MWNYETIVFVIKYLACIIMMIHLFKTKIWAQFPQALSVSFIGFSVVIVVNLIISIFKQSQLNQPFYYISFIDFILIVLILNYLLNKRSEKKQKAKL